MSDHKAPEKNDEPPINLKWGKFGLKMLLALVWLIAATAATSFTSNPDPVAPSWLLPLAVTTACAPLVWSLWSCFQIRRLDEREQRIAFQSLYMGYNYAISFGCLMWLSAVWTGVKSADFSDFNPTSVVILPALGFFFGEAMTQYFRWMELHGPNKTPKP